MKTTLCRLIMGLLVCALMLTMLPASLAETAAADAEAGILENSDLGDDPNDEPTTPGKDATPLTLADFGMEMPVDEGDAGIESSYLKPQTLVITADNENNYHTGYADGDINKYLFSNNRISPIEVRFDLNELPARSAYLAIYSYDCDEANGSAPEYDAVYVNNTKVGVMTGENGQWNTTLISVPVSALKVGANYVTIHMGIKYLDTGRIIEDYYKWAIRVKWLQLILDGGSSGDRPEEFAVALQNTTLKNNNIYCDAQVTISSSISRRYEVEYSLVDKTSPSSPTYQQIISTDVSTVTGSTILTTGTLKLALNAPSGEYTVQVLLKNASTSEILAADETSFKYTTNKLPRFDVTNLAATLSDDEYTNKNITMEVTAKADISAGISNIRCHLNGVDKGPMSMDAEGNLSITLPISANDIYLIEITYQKDGENYSVMLYKTVDNIDKTAPTVQFTATKNYTVIVNYTDDRSGVASASYAISNSTTAPDASKFTKMPSSGSAIAISDDQYMHCTFTDKAGNTKTACFVPLRSISINLNKITIGKGQTVQTIKVTYNPSNATDKTLTWTSAKASIATADSSGKINGVKKGSTSVTITSNNGKTASFKVKVVGKGLGVTKITLNKTEATIKDGKTLTLKATIKPNKAKDKSVIWISSNPGVATINSKGKIKAVAPGETTITAYSSSGIAATCKITVVNVKVSKVEVTGKKTMKTGKTQKLTATITPTNATNKAIEWTTSDASIATVDQNGKVTGISAGVVTITATAKDGSKASGSIKITVTGKLVKKIAISGDKTMKVGATQQLTATITPTDADIQTLKWKSSNTKIATVDENGVVTALKKGSVTITATAQDGSKIKATFAIKVKK